MSLNEILFKSSNTKMKLILEIYQNDTDCVSK